MEIYCIEDFKVEFEKLISKKSYSSLNQEIIDYFFNKSFHQLCSGTRLILSFYGILLYKPYLLRLLFFKNYLHSYCYSKNFFID